MQFSLENLNSLEPLENRISKLEKENKLLHTKLSQVTNEINKHKNENLETNKIIDELNTKLKEIQN